MKYKINSSNYHTFSIFKVNKLPARSYFIPYSNRAGADAAAPKECDRTGYLRNRDTAGQAGETMENQRRGAGNG